MNPSRRELYRAGEPLGECVTRRKLGGGLICGGGGGGGSSSSSSTTNNIDKRIAVGDGGLGISADSSSVAVNIMDGGIVSRALDSIDTANAIGAQGYSKLLDTAVSMFNKSEGLIGQTNAIGAQGYSKLLDTAVSMFNKSEGLIGQTQKAVADAYDQAQLNAKGTIDNKTIIVLAVAGAAAAVMIARK